MNYTRSCYWNIQVNFLWISEKDYIMKPLLHIWNPRLQYIMSWMSGFMHSIRENYYILPEHYSLLLNFTYMESTALIYYIISEWLHAFHKGKLLHFPRALLPFLPLKLLFKMYNGLSLHFLPYFAISFIG